jgi:DNA-binding MarR family transcriptional regulator
MVSWKLYYQLPAAASRWFRGNLEWGVRLLTLVYWRGGGSAIMSNLPDDQAKVTQLDGRDHLDDHRDNANDTAALSAEVLALLAQVTGRFESQEHEEWRWIEQHSSDPRVVELLRDSTIMALRVVDAIGRLEPVNGITIAAQFRIPKGTVSKVTRRLITQQLVSVESRPKNRKEILFRLTPLGRQFFELHRRFDEQMERGFRRFLERYDAADLRVLVRVLHDATEASFLTLGLPVPSLQNSTERANGD